ncbi:MAG TPA: hypothetical protein VFA83_17500 [Acidimicrobiales bacterium]|nr:hypothetical protein [Acidimicrobiales bacterium]
MSRPANAEKGSDGAADALRKFIAKPIGVHSVIAIGWRRVDHRGTATFVAPFVPEGTFTLYTTTTTPGKGDGLVSVTFARKNGRWKYQASSFGCVGTVERRGVTGAEWALDPSASAPPSDATAIPVLVRERACTGGARIGDRLLSPEISYDATEVKVTYYARPIPVGKGEAVTCPGVPPDHVTLHLSQPLGSRALLDGSTLPAHAPTADSSWTLR